jgi:cell division protein FtsI (penicillin-binding protein 3)
MRFARQSKAVNPAAISAAADMSQRNRITARVCVVLMTLILLGLLGRVYQLQAYPSPKITAMMGKQAGDLTLDARRGALIDRRGRDLAVTRLAYRLFVDPDLVDDPNTFSEYVGYTLGYDPAWVEMTIAKRRGSRYILLDQRLSDERLKKYRELDLKGLAIEPTLVRDYPQGVTAGQVVGFVGAEGKGLAGLELSLDRRLAPDPGQYAYVRDRSRNVLWLADQHYEPHTDGEPIRLSLDINIQDIAEQELQAAVAEFEAEAGQLLVMDPYTGEILAMANYPAINPTAFGSADPKLRRNRSVTDVFEPGSVMKPFVWAAAIEAGQAHPDEMIDTTEVGWWKPARGPVLRDASPHGEISWDDILKYSSNIGIAKVAERMGRPMLYDIIASYGFGQPTGSGLPGEVAGLLRPEPKWSHTDLTRIPMGQGVAVTPLQVTRAFCALANDGVLIRPSIEAIDGGTVQRPEVTSRVLSPHIARHTREVLGRVIIDGTGRKARSDLYDLFGKTGTAQLPDLKNGGYYDDQYISSFIAGAPIDRPRLVVGCYIHRPNKAIGHYGGTVAGPPVKRVIERSLQYLGVPTKPTAAD